MRRNKKPKSLKFYLCLMGILAGIYLVLVAVLAIRNPVESKTESASSSVSIEENLPVTVTETPSLVPTAVTDEDEKEEADPQEDQEQDQKEESAAVAEGKDDYGRGKERYTTFDAQDIFTDVNVKILNDQELRAVTGASYDSVKSYLNIYASHNGIQATRCRMLYHQYIGELGDRIEIYMKYNDPDKTLVTVIYEPADSSHSSHVDVVPCQYTAKEIKKMKKRA